MQLWSTLDYEGRSRKMGCGAKIHRLVWTGGVLDCFRGCDGAPCRGWIPAPYRVWGRLFAGMTEVGDFGGGVRPVRHASAQIHEPCRGGRPVHHADDGENDHDRQTDMECSEQDWYPPFYGCYCQIALALPSSANCHSHVWMAAGRCSSSLWITSNLTLFRFAWDLMIRYQSRETGSPMRGNQHPWRRERAARTCMSGADAMPSRWWRPRRPGSSTRSRRGAGR